MRRERRLLNSVGYIVLLHSISCVAAAASDSNECETDASCHPDSFLEFGSWVFEDPKLVARCDGYQVLVVFANGTDMLFLDESARLRNSATRPSEQGMAFGEFNFYHAAYEIKEVSCEVLDSGEVKVAGTASDQDDGSSFRFRIVADTTHRSYTYEDTKPRAGEG